MGKIACRWVLVSRSILPLGADIHCVMCNRAVETSDHLLVGCNKAWVLWSAVVNWWGLSWVCPCNVNSLMPGWFGSNYKKFERYIWEALFCSVVWNIWLTRNGVIFEQKEHDFQNLFISILSQAACWVKADSSMHFDINDFIFHIDQVRKLK